MSFYSDREPIVYATLAGKNKDGSYQDRLKWKIKDGQKEAMAEVLGPIELVDITYKPQDPAKPDFPARFIVHASAEGKKIQIQLSENAGYTRSVIKALASLKKGDKVRFSAKFGENKDRPTQPYYNVYVLRYLGEGMDDEFIKGDIPKESIPAVREIQATAGGKKFLDDSERLMFFKNLAEQIHNRWSAQPAPAPIAKPAHNPQGVFDRPSIIPPGTKDLAANPFAAPPTTTAMPVSSGEDDDLPF